ncbi:MAG: hypothetical protein EA381_17745 [Planctomycetaceae bacterium]|nr:MAG: hypothetical protein EA381_17745 [Planctomycetaceae bacterium]
MGSPLLPHHPAEFLLMASQPTLPRRRFLQNAAAGVALAPAIWTGKRTAAQGVIGAGEHQFRFDHDWAKLPEPFRWQTTHGVAVDPEDNLYVIHEGQAELIGHPSIFVFDPQGRLIRSFGQMFQGGGHGVDIRVEGDQAFLYVAAYQQAKTFAKFTLDGELVWQAYAPMASGHYAAGEAAAPTKVWGRDRFLPTNFAFLPDGGFLLADGYGAYYIHRYDRDANWVSSFGGPGSGKGTFNLPHGIWVDNRGERPEIVVTDRAHHTLQVFSIEGEYSRTIEGFGLPANADTWGDWLVIPELVARVSILDKDLKTVVTLGDDVERVLEDKSTSGGFGIRADASRWQGGKFVHPHDACFDSSGNLFVAEWVSTGRITKLTRV